MKGNETQIDDYTRIWKGLATIYKIMYSSMDRRFLPGKHLEPQAFEEKCYLMPIRKELLLANLMKMKSSENS